MTRIPSRLPNFTRGTPKGPYDLLDIPSGITNNFICPECWKQLDVFIESGIEVQNDNSVKTLFWDTFVCPSCGYLYRDNQGYDVGNAVMPIEIEKSPLFSLDWVYELGRE